MKSNRDFTDKFVLFTGPAEDYMGKNGRRMNV